MAMLTPDDIDRALAVFGRGHLQDLLTLSDHLRSLGLTMEDARRHLDRLRGANRQAERHRRRMMYAYARRAKACPACGAPMSLYPVNSGPRDQVGGDWRAQWLCPNPRCAETLYVTETTTQIMRALGFVPASKPAVTPASKVRNQRRCGNGTT